MTDSMLATLFGRLTVPVQENQRAIVLRDGVFHAILRPGIHRFSTWGHEYTTQFFDLTRAEFVSVYEQALFRTRRDLVEAHLTEIRTGVNEVGVILRDGRLFGVQKPEGRAVLWSDAGPWEVERIDISGGIAVTPDLSRRLERFGALDKTARFQVNAESAGLLFVDGAFERQLEPGSHMFWAVGQKIEVKQVDLRRRSLDVTGQEILTRDRVSIRVNLAAEFRVIDAIKAVTEVKDFEDALYRAIQYAFRKTRGSKTLDDILEQKVSVDAEAAETVRAEMSAIGVEVGEIALKDVILPGEIREILNKVVAAEKEAQANVIRRREETAATRSLLNTARVMEENPIMLRLKELEALEGIADKVDSLVVHNGPKGLLNDLAKLRDD